MEPDRPAPAAGPAAGAAAPRPLLEVDRVTFGYDDRPVLEDVSFVVREGDFLAVLGPNGGGKTTLLKILLGLLTPWSGTVRRHLSGRRGALGYVPQFAGFDRSFPLRVEDLVRMGRLGLRGPVVPYRRSDRTAAARAVERMGLAAQRRAHVSELSGGQLQRALIARALAGDPELLLLDEPLASVDAEARLSLVDLLRELHHDIPVLVVTHDLTPFAGAVRQIACVNRRLHYHAEGRLTSAMLEEVYGCPVELIAHGVPHRVLAPHADPAEPPR